MQIDTQNVIAYKIYTLYTIIQICIQQNITVLGWTYNWRQREIFNLDFIQVPCLLHFVSKLIYIF